MLLKKWTSKERKAFLLVLAVTVVVWFGTAMNDGFTYRSTYKIEWRGFDSVQYAVPIVDSVFSLSLPTRSSVALRRSLFEGVQSIEVDLTQYLIGKNQEEVDVALSRRDIEALCREQHPYLESVNFSIDLNEAHIKLSRRRSKAFVPQLNGLEITYAPQYGMAGKPLIIPDTVKLYGSQESLSKIDNISIVPCRLENVSGRDTHLLALEPVWEAYPDVKISSPSVGLFIPTKRYVEKTISLPVVFQSDDNYSQVRLYPSSVKVSFWIAADDYRSVGADDFKAVVQYNGNQEESQLPVMVSCFPADAHIKEISPSNVRYVIFK